MTDQDAAENRALVAANAVSAQVCQLWMAAHTEGMRNGMEAAAGLADAVATSMRDDYSIDADLRAISVNVLEQLRDQIRLCALTMPEPETPQPESETRDA